MPSITAIIAMMMFLEENGYEVVAEQKKLLRMALAVVLAKPSVEQIVSKYLKKYCRPISKRKRIGHYIDTYKLPILNWFKKLVSDSKFQIYNDLNSPQD